MKRYLTSFVFIGIGLSIPAFGGSLAGDASNPPDTLWQTDGAGKTELDFIPEGLLNRELPKRFESLRLPSRSTEVIGQRIQWSRERATAGKSPCSFGIQGALPGGEGEPLPEGLNALEAAKIVIVGNVQHLVKGLRADGEAATLIHIRVERILRGELSVHVGNDVTILERIGRVTIGGTEICTESPDYRLPREGAEVVVAGDPDPVNPGNLISGEHLLFFLQNGTVNRGARKPTNWQPITLKELDQFLNAGGSR